MDSLGAHRLCAQASAEVVIAAGEGADADQVEADLDRLDGLEGLEQADAAVAEDRVGEPVLGRQWLAAGFLECLRVEVFGSEPLRRTGANASEGVPGAFSIASDKSDTPSCSSVTRKSSNSRMLSLSPCDPVPSPWLTKFDSDMSPPSRWMK
jgi:hypothetical protein